MNDTSMTLVLKPVKYLWVVLVVFCQTVSAAVDPPSSETLASTKTISYEYWLENIADHTPPQWLPDAEKADWTPPLNIITVGAHINSLYGLDHKLQAFEANIDFWAQWKGPVYGWDQTETLNPTEDFFTNNIRTSDYTFESYPPYESGNLVSTDINVDGYFSSEFDYKRFPFDNQTLVVTLSMGADAYEYRLTTGVRPTVQPNFNKIMDYQVTEVSFSDFTSYYPTTFGVPDYADGEGFASSGVKLSIRMERFFLNSFVDYVLPLLVIGLLLLINQSKLSTDRGVKLTLPPAALLSLIFLKTGADESLPALNYLVYLDLLYLGSFVLIMICFIEATLFKFMDDIAPNKTASMHRCRRGLILFSWMIFILWPAVGWQLVSATS